MTVELIPMLNIVKVQQYFSTWRYTNDYGFIHSSSYELDGKSEIHFLIPLITSRDKKNHAQIVIIENLMNKSSSGGYFYC